MATALATVNESSNTSLTGDAFSNPAYYEHVKNVAGLLASGAFTPKHLISPQNPNRTIATCTRIVIQALRWDFDPFAVADETYEVHGRLGYQGKLIIAVVNARANLKGRLTFTYAGQNDDLTVTVSGQFADEDKPRTITLSVKQGKTANDMWKKDPEQKLAYSGAIKWARRHCPELVMGVRTVEDLESMTVDAPKPRQASNLDELTDQISEPVIDATPEPSPEPDDAEPGDTLEAVPTYPPLTEIFAKVQSIGGCDDKAEALMTDPECTFEEEAIHAARDARKAEIRASKAK